MLALTPTHEHIIKPSTLTVLDTDAVPKQGRERCVLFLLVSLSGACKRYCGTPISYQFKEYKSKKYRIEHLRSHLEIQKGHKTIN